MNMIHLFSIALVLLCALIGQVSGFNEAMYTKEHIREIMNVALDVAKQVGEDTKMDDLFGTVVKRIGYDYMIDPSVVDIYLDPEVLHLWPSPATLRAWDLKYSRMCEKGVTVRWPVDFAIKEYL